MQKKSKSVRQFKSKGANILEGHLKKPNSMMDFLENTQNQESTSPHIHKSANPQKHSSTNENFLGATGYQMHKTSESQSYKVCRLHIQIRQDLVDKLLDMVFKRKRDPAVKMRDASQRAIVEEALEKYFVSND
jgi:phage terminase large subunit-like protein